MAHLLKYLLYKHENLSSILRTHIEKARHIFVIPGLGSQWSVGFTKKWGSRRESWKGCRQRIRETLGLH